MRRFLLAAATGSLLVWTVPAVASAAPAAGRRPLCQGHRATIVVTGHGKTVRGTGHSDVIVALGAGDVITAGAGNDLICAGAAKSIDAGPGDDSVTFWGSGVVHAGSGNDHLTQLSAPGSKRNAKAACQGAGSPKVFGDTGNDTIRLGCGNGTAWGGAGNDTIYGGTGHQTLYGGDGNDRLQRGRSGTFRLVGGAGSNVIDGVPQPTLGSGSLSPVTASPPDGLSVRLFLDEYQPFEPPFDPARITELGPGQPAASHEFDPIVSVPAGLTVASWSMSFGDETPAVQGTGTVPKGFPHVYDQTGLHEGVITVTDSGGTVATASFGVDVAPFPTLNPAVVTVDPDTVTAVLDLTQVLPAAAQPAGDQIIGVEILWGDGTGEDPYYGVPYPRTHVYPRAGDYDVTATLDTLYGNLTVPAHVSVADGLPHAVLRLPTEDWYGKPATTTAIPAGGDYDGNTGVPLAFDTASSQGAVSLDFGDGSPVSTAPNPSHSYAPGHYTATLVATLNGQTATSRTTLDLVVPDAAAVVHLPSSATVGEPVTLSAAGSHASIGANVVKVYGTWGDVPDLGQDLYDTTLPPTITHSFDSPGTYNVLFYVLDDHGGLAKTTRSITVTD